MKLTPRKVCHILNEYEYEGSAAWQHRVTEVDVGEYEDEYFVDLPTGQERTLSWLTAEGVAEKLVKEGLVKEPDCHCCDQMQAHLERWSISVISYDPANQTYRIPRNKYEEASIVMVACPFCGERLNG